LTPSTPRGKKFQRGISTDQEQYEHIEIEYLTRLGVDSYAEVTEELLSTAEPDVVKFFRRVLCEGAAASDQVKTYKDLMPKSEAKYDDAPFHSGMSYKKKPQKYEDSEGTPSIDSTDTVKNVVKHRKHVKWLHEAFLNLATFMSKIVDIMLGAPMVSFFCLVALYLYFFNSETIKIFTKEFLLGAARGTLKAIQGNNGEVIDKNF